MSALVVIPNALSVARLFCAAVFPFAPPSYRLPLLLVAAITDFADGQIARRFHLSTWIGGLLDGVADKLFALSALLTLTAGNELELWQTPLLLTRDITVGLIALYAAARRKWYAFRRMPARMLGKITTAALFLLMILIVTLPAGHPVFWVAFSITVALGILAAADYLNQFFIARRIDQAQSNA